MENANLFRAHFGSFQVFPEENDYLNLNWGKRLDKNLIWLINQVISTPIPICSERTRRMTVNPSLFGFASFPVHRELLYLRGDYSHFVVQGEFNHCNQDEASLVVVIHSSASYPYAAYWGAASKKLLMTFSKCGVDWVTRGFKTGFNLYEELGSIFSGTEKYARIFFKYNEGGSWQVTRQATLNFLYSYIGDPFE